MADAVPNVDGDLAASISDDELAEAVSKPAVGSDEELEEPTAALDGEPTAANALRENIARKGKNAYYYAHASTANAPAWDGSEAPRLLERKPSGPVEEGGGSIVKRIAKFAWGDETACVKVYVNLEDNGITAPVEVAVTSTDSSAVLTLSCTSAGGRAMEHVLDLSDVYDKIDSATAKLAKSGSRVILTLKKAESSRFTWHDLKRSK